MLLNPSKDSDYAIASALRGPDERNASAETIKWLTTAVIRNLAGMSSDVLGGPWSSTIEKARALYTDFTPGFKPKLRADWSALSHHFKLHVEIAFEQFPGEGLDYWYWIKARLEGSIIE